MPGFQSEPHSFGFSLEDSYDLMNYPHIVSVIDLQIERLRQARTLLLESAVPAVSSVQTPVEAPASATNLKPAAAEVVARRVAPRLRSTPRRARQHVAEPTALSGAPPAGPVCIPAAQVHAPAVAVSATPRHYETGAESASPAEDGTLDALLRKSSNGRNGHHISPEAQARQFFGV